MDIYRQRRFSRLSLHSKGVLLMTAGLLLSGWIFFFITEYANRNTLGDPSLNLSDKLMAALFQSATTRTAGFNTIDQGSLNAASKFMSALLMFVGASPAGTGGGVKTSTVAVLLLVVITVIQGKEDITLFQRRLARGIGFRALAITLISFGLVLLITMALSLSERAIPFENLLFETISAFGTVGLSTGITPYLKPVSKVFIIITMFAGRVGPLTLATAFARRLRTGNAGYKYPEDRIIVG
jgi:trk system potassium uptake protein TrkH